MIVRDAIRSLKNSMAKAVFYWLTFVLTSMFVFLFFNISMSESLGFTWINNNNDTVTTVTVFVITICLIIIFFANDFFVKNKARELAIRLVCGATFLQLAEYLLVQTFILMVIAIPFGITGALILVPVLNGIISSILNSPFSIGIYPYAVLTTIIILGLVVFWTTYLNLSFAYRNSASMLLNERKLINPLSGFSMIDDNFVLTEKEKEERRKEKLARRERGAKFRKIACIILFLFPLIVFHFNRDMALVVSIFGMVGFYLGVPNVIIPELNRLTRDSKTDDPELLAVAGFYRTDLTILRSNIILFLASAILLVCIAGPGNNASGNDAVAAVICGHECSSFPGHHVQVLYRGLFPSEILHDAEPSRLCKGRQGKNHQQRGRPAVSDDSDRCPAVSRQYLPFHDLRQCAHMESGRTADPVHGHSSRHCLAVYHFLLQAFGADTAGRKIS